MSVCVCTHKVMRNMFNITCVLKSTSSTWHQCVYACVCVCAYTKWCETCSTWRQCVCWIHKVMRNMFHMTCVCVLTSISSTWHQCACVCVCLHIKKWWETCSTWRSVDVSVPDKSDAKHVQHDEVSTSVWQATDNTIYNTRFSGLLWGGGGEVLKQSTRTSFRMNSRHILRSGWVDCSRSAFGKFQKCKIAEVQPRTSGFQDGSTTTPGRRWRRRRRRRRRKKK